ncbi:MAG: low molecular weight phosphotyrosine protein phosphatase [Phycisphaerae bacterium]|nr:low molecular weight phosphotyrosine protein phosphatase [Phycisphaerae bacterium]
MSQRDKINVLFVCMGNICRSPMAEALFVDQVERAGLSERFYVDSAGTGGWHAGEPPDARMTATAQARGVSMSGAARQVTLDDLGAFQYVLCMDSDNLHNVRALGDGDATIELMLSYHKQCGETDVPDPYYGGEEGFDRVYELLDVSTAALLKSLCARHIES